MNNKGNTTILVILGIGVVIALGAVAFLFMKPQVVVQLPQSLRGFQEELNMTRFREVATVNLVEAGVDDSLLAAKTDHATLTPEEFCDETIIRSAASSGNMTLTLPNLASTTSEARGCLLVDGAVRNIFFFGSGTTSSLTTIATGTGWTSLRQAGSSTVYTFTNGRGALLKAIRTSATAGVLVFEEQVN